MIPRLRGLLESYTYFLLDKLKTPRNPLTPTHKPPNKPHVWLKTSQTEVVEGDENVSSQPAHIDIFQEREGAGGMRVGRDFQAKIPPLLTDEGTIFFERKIDLNKC
jgi:hypothetical protein